MDRVQYGISLRLAVVKKVSPTFIDCQFVDRIAEPTKRVPIPHPYAGSGGNGIFVGIQEGTLVLLSKGTGEKWFVVSIIPDPTFNGSTQGIGTATFNQNQYPTLEQGEISFIGTNGQFIDILNSGNIQIDIGVGSKIANFELSEISEGLFTRINQTYTFTEAGRTVEGVIKRDLSITEDPNITGTVNFLDGETYDLLLDSVGRSSADEVHSRTTNLLKQTIRNPALIEKKTITYEYADSFNVQDFESEFQAMSSINQANQISLNYLKKDPTIRQNRRTDALNLNTRNYNHLIEKIEGTVVDIYGNILDLNRGIINTPLVNSFSGTNADNKSKASLKETYDYLRRSIKYHFEINSRKDITTTDAPLNPENNFQGNSRFSVDIDAEGLTKINIPASSETGNVPILGRYITNVNPNDENQGSYRAQDQVDIELIQFGAPSESNPDNFSGASISNDEYLPPVFQDTSVTVGTAFHDILNIANSIFTVGKLKSPDPINEPNEVVGPIETIINNKIVRLDADFNTIINNIQNAGGRSAHINMDGSMELNVGADTADRKSLNIDLAGGTVSHYGRDKNGRSIIHQSDGDVIIQIGGNAPADPRFPVGSLPNDPTTNRPGRLEIHFNRGEGQDPHIIYIDENGINISSQGHMVLTAESNIILSAGGNLLLDGEQIYHYAQGFDEDTGDIIAPEIRVRRTGNS